jgi:hypothetical protein
MKIANGEELVTLGEAARGLETTELNVLLHIKRGLLAGREVDGAWHVVRSGLETLRARRGAGGEPICRPTCCGCTSCDG